MCDHLGSPDGLRITREDSAYGLFWVVRHREDMDVLKFFVLWPDAVAWANRYIELES